jgi:tripartite-type tricarboxylate transporter receptor subunit TctC
MDVIYHAPDNGANHHQENSMSRRLLAAAVLAIAATTAAAQEYPTRPIKLIVPFPPGGGTDILARVVAQKVAENNKWTVVVDNRPGAGGNIGVDAAAKSPPDGYTLVMGQTSNLAINPSLQKKMPYDSQKDLAPIALVGQGPVAVVVRTESPYKSFADLVKAAKAKPGSVTMASPGNGTVAHLAGVQVMNVSGAKFEHIPYKGAGAAMPDLLGGNVDFFMSSVPTVQSHVANGKVRALAVTSTKRSPVLPDAPTIGEAYKGFDAVTWFGILAPAGTPKPIIDKLNAEINKALQDPKVRETIGKEGGEVMGGTPQQMADHIKREIAAWAPIVKASGATVD